MVRSQKREILPAEVDDVNTAEKTAEILGAIKVEVLDGVRRVDLSAIKDPVVRNLVAHYETRIGDLLAAEDVQKKRNETLGKVNAVLKRDIYTDALTKIGNRRFFNKKIKEEVTRAMRYGHSVSLLFIDADHFRSVNNTYGHPTGDKVLRSIARILKNVVRDMDVVCRYGGEEFCVILPETSKKQALILAKRVSKAVKDAKSLAVAEDGTKIKKTISIGVSGVTFDKDSKGHARDISKKITSDADENLYLLKHEITRGKRKFDNRGKIAMDGAIIDPSVEQ
jgi:diguanylate cyclase (GGDEF)-like protein